MANPLQGIVTLGGNVLGGLGNVASGVFGTTPGNPIGTQVQTAVGNVLNTNTSNPITQQIGQFIGNLLGTNTGGTSSGNLLGFSGLGGSGGSSSSGLLGGLLGGSGGIGNLLMAGIPAYLLGKAAMEETKNQRGVPLIPLTQETKAGRYNIEAEIRRRMGLPAPDPVEFGMLPAGTIPQLSGSRPSAGVSYEMASQTVPNLEVASGAPRYSAPVAPQPAPVAAMPAPRPPLVTAPPPTPVARPQVAEDVSYETAAAAQRAAAARHAQAQSIRRAQEARAAQAQAARQAQAAGMAQAARAGQIPMGMVQRYRNGGIVGLAEGGMPKVEIEIETEDGESMDASEFERMNGDINGEGTEVSDDVPAMLSDGEFVMTGRAVRGAGTFDMNVGEGGIITLTPGGTESRERGTDLMYQMMSLFSEYAGAPEEDD